MESLISVNLKTRRLLTVMLFLMPSVIVHACPSDCHCVKRTVDCADVGITEVPEQIQANVKNLNFENNNIKNFTDQNLIHLKKLRTLNLKNNEISALLPGSFDNLRGLRNLKLSYNNIKSLPQGIFMNLDRLSDLDLSYNSLQNVDGELMYLKNLYQLDLTGNNLDWISGQTFEGLRKLRYLKLGNNNISVIADNAFRKIPRLTYLSIRENPLWSVDGYFTYNTELAYVELTECNLQNFPHLLPKALQNIQLGQNNITSIHHYEVSELKSLKFIIMDLNNIQNIEAEAFNNMADLQELWLNSNRLRNIPEGLPRKLKAFHIDNNEIDSMGTTSFHSQSAMETLSVQGNMITQLNRESFKNLKMLRNLHLSGNYFSEISDSVFSDLQNLNLLQLDRLDLTSIATDAFQGLSNLTELAMSYILCEDGAIQGNIYKHFKRLKTLSLQESSYIAATTLSSESMMKSLSTLEELNLMDNQISTLKSSLMSNLPRLSLIKLSGNLFHCDRRLIWLKQWISSQAYKFESPGEIECYTPHWLNGKLINNLPLHDFVATTLAPFLLTSPIHNPVPEVTELETIHHGILSSSTMPKPTKTTKCSSCSSNEPMLSSNHTNLQTTNTTEFTVTTPKGNNSLSNPLPQDQSDKEAEEMNNLLVVTIATSLSITTIVIIIVVMVIMFYRRRNHFRHQEMTYHEENDTVFVPCGDNRPPIPPQRLTREDRGSVTSKADEDITNGIDTSMKVYTWDGDQ